MTFGFPELNASLNALAGVLLVCGYVAIRLRHVRLHIVCMLTALTVSAIFLGFYLYFHFAILKGKPTYFSEKVPEAPEWVRYLYYGILWSHIFLAIAIAVMAPTTAWLGLRGHYDRHVPLARWTFPIWLYVSITGVVVYWMLYRMYA